MTAMSELQRLKGLLPPEMQSWVFVEADRKSTRLNSSHQ